MGEKRDLKERLDRITEAINAKGHPMQDYSSLKTALLDVIEVMREMMEVKGQKLRS